MDFSFSMQFTLNPLPLTDIKVGLLVKRSGIPCQTTPLRLYLQQFEFKYLASLTFLVSPLHKPLYLFCQIIFIPIIFIHNQFANKYLYRNILTGPGLGFYREKNNAKTPSSPPEMEWG